MTSRIRISSITLVLAAALLIAVAPSASAAKLKTRSATTTIGPPAGNAGSATATCPKGSKATGGGFSYSPAPTTANSLRVYESVKSGGRSWRASAVQLGSAGPARTLTALVNCEAGAPKLKQRSVSTTTVAGGATTGTVSCPSSKKVVAGGFVTTFPTATPAGIPLIYESFKTGARTWQASVIDVTGVDTLTVQAYCLKAKAPKTTSGSATIAGPGTLGSASSAPCAGSRKAKAGGFSAPPTTAPPGLLTIYESQRVGKTWRASGMQTGAGTNTLTGLDYCR